MYILPFLNCQVRKYLFQMAILTKFDQIAAIFWICCTVKWTGSFMWESFFDLYWVFSQVLNIINLKMLCQIHVTNFWHFLVFKKHQSWVWIVQSARIFISEHSDTYSHKIWNVIYRLVQIYKRIAEKFYPKLTIYLSTVFCRGHYLSSKTSGLI